MLCMLKMMIKGEVGDCALNSHGNYIVDHGKIMELCFLISVGTLFHQYILLSWQRVKTQMKCFASIKSIRVKVNTIAVVLLCIFEFVLVYM